MSFCKKYEINDLLISIGRGHEGGFNIFLDLDSAAIVEAINTKDPKLLDALKLLLLRSNEIDLNHSFDEFERYSTRGYGYAKYNIYDWDEINIRQFKINANKVIESELADEHQKDQAKKLLLFLKGEIPRYIPTESELFQQECNRKLNRYQKNRSKWERLLIDAHGYKCTKCEIISNLRIKHLVSINKGGNTELGNLEFRCTKCMSK